MQKNHFSEDITTLFTHVLTMTPFKLDNQLHEELDGIAMENLVSPVIANYYVWRLLRQQQVVQFQRNQLFGITSG